MAKGDVHEAQTNKEVTARSPAQAASVDLEYVDNPKDTNYEEGQDQDVSEVEEVNQPKKKKRVQ